MKKQKEIIKQILNIKERTLYNWRKEGRPIISLLEKYFTQEELEEFLETGEISSFFKKKSPMFKKLEERISFLDVE